MYVVNTYFSQDSKDIVRARFQNEYSIKMSIHETELMTEIHLKIDARFINT